MNAINFRHLGPVLLAVVITIGCARDEPVADKPSYADLVVIYNTELSALDRLEKKRSDLIAQYQQQQQPSADDALKALDAVLNSAAQLKADQTDQQEPLTPDEALDQAAANVESAQQVATDLLNSVTATTAEEENAAPTAESEAFASQLAALDAEIAKQKERVERARQARDAAESQ